MVSAERIEPSTYRSKFTAGACQNEGNEGCPTEVQCFDRSVLKMESSAASVLAFIGI
jgi:hypothetical protein